MNDLPEDPAAEDSRPGNDVAQDLKATADSIRADLGRLAEIEETKATLDGADPAVDRLSDEAVDLADRISRQTRVERQLGEELA